MTDFLSRLAKRQLDPVSPIRPRVLSMYATPVSAMSADGEPQTAPPERISAAISPETIAAPAMVPHAHREAATESTADMEASLYPPAIDPLRRDKDLTTDSPFRPLVKTPLAIAASDLTVTEPHASSPQSDGSRAAVSPRPVVRAMETPLDRAAVPMESPTPRQETRESSRIEPPSAPPSLLARLSSRVAAVQESDAAEPEVHVTIGRIEVTAVHAPSSPKRAPAPGKKPMSLDEYLAKRNGGRK